MISNTERHDDSVNAVILLYKHKFTDDLMIQAVFYCFRNTLCVQMETHNEFVKDFIEVPYELIA